MKSEITAPVIRRIFFFFHSGLLNLCEVVDRMKIPQTSSNCKRRLAKGLNDVHAERSNARLSQKRNPFEVRRTSSRSTGEEFLLKKLAELLRVTVKEADAKFLLELAEVDATRSEA